MRTLTCPRCRKPWEVDALHAGMKAVCPNCHASITISAGPTAAKPSPASAGSGAATMAPAPAIAKPAAVNVPEAVKLQASGDSIPASAQAASSRAAVTPLPPVVPDSHLPTALNGSTSPVQAQPISEIVAQAKNDRTEVPFAIDRPMSRRPMAVATVALLVVAGGFAAIWRPWDQRQDPPVVALPSNEGLPIPSAIPSPSAIEAPSTLQKSPPSIAELPLKVEPPPGEQKLPQATPSVIKPAPVARPSNNPAPSVKPSPTAPPTPAVVRTPTVSAPPASTTSIIRKPSPPPTYNRAPLEPGTEGTQPLTPQTPLKAGDHLHGQYEGRWYAVTVVETLDDGNVRVRWDTWGKDVIGSIPRVRLRLPAKK